MLLTCRIPREIEAVPITVAGVDYLAVRREDLDALFHEPAPVTKQLPDEHAPARAAKPARAARKKTAGKPERAPKGEFTRRVMSALPGTMQDIATRTGINYKSVYSALKAMRKRGEVAGEGGRGGVWRKAAAPNPETAKPAREHPVTSLKAFLASELARGPRDSGELMLAARKAGYSVDRFDIDKTLDSCNEVIGGHGSRWSLAKGYPAHA